MEDFEPSEERPWTEAQWEAFMKRQDARSARFAELLETTMDQPDQLEIVSREMGWDDVEPEDGEDVDDDESDFAPAEEWLAELDEAPDAAWEVVSEQDEAFEGEELFEGAEDISEEEGFSEPDDGLNEVPAYRIAYDLGLKVHDALRPFLLLHEQEDAEVARRLGETMGNALVPAAKISGGHAMGYDEEVLCGNIVCCKRALEAATECRRDLGELMEEGLLPRVLAEDLRREMGRVLDAVEGRVAELRSSVWWE